MVVNIFSGRRSRRDHFDFGQCPTINSPLYGSVTPFQPTISSNGHALSAIARIVAKRDARAKQHDADANGQGEEVFFYCKTPRV